MQAEYDIIIFVFNKGQSPAIQRSGVGTIHHRKK